MIKDNRARLWTFIVYPESVLPEWQHNLRSLCIPCAISPLHDSDLLEDGSPKKSHYHVILAYQGKKSLEQVKEVSALCSSVLPIPVQDLRSMYRYLTHADHPDKHQYSESDIVLLNGFQKPNPSKQDENVVLREIVQFVIDNEIDEVLTLTQIALVQFPEWLDTLLSRNTYFLTKLIDSIRHTKSNKNKETFYD